MIKDRVATLDELRGFAICAVMLSHIGLVYGADLGFAYVLNVPAFGVGVDLFFVISGFVIYRNLEEMTARSGGDRRLGALAFWLRRFVRIALPAWATVGAIAALEALTAGAQEFPGDLVAAAGFYANTHWGLCFQAETNCGDPLWSSHFWSLGLEMQFYALVPLLAAVPGRAALIGALGVLTASAAFARPQGSLLWTMRPDALLVGVWLGSQEARSARWLDKVPSVTGAQALYWVFVAAILERLAVSVLSGVAIVAVASIFGFVLAGRLRAPALGGAVGRASRRAGEVSFSLYLVHLPLLTWAHVALSGRIGPAWALVIALVLIGATTMIWEKAVVRPAARLGRNASAAVTSNNLPIVARKV